MTSFLNAYQEGFEEAVLRNPFRIDSRRREATTQGSETLGWKTQSRWD